MTLPLTKLVASARPMPRVALVLDKAVRTACEGWQQEPVPFFGVWDRTGPVPVARARSVSTGEGLEQLGEISVATVPPGTLRLAPDATGAWLEGASVEVLSGEEDRYRDRVVSLPGVEALRGRTAVLVGLGSVGSDLGARLARVGVRVVGCDPDLLATENLIRWGLPATVAQDVGHLKAWVWEQTLRRTVPDVQVEGHGLDIVAQGQAFAALLERERPDLLIVATDTRDSRRTANAMAATYRIPALFVALSDGAASVRIEVVEDAAQGPCHLCSQRAEGSLADGASRGSRMPYAADLAPPPRAVPALPVDVALGATLTARVALQMLAGLSWRELLNHGEQEGNVMFLGLRPGFWVFESMWDRLVYQAERHPDCPTCGESSMEV